MRGEEGATAFPPLPPPFLKTGGEGGRLVATSPYSFALDEGAEKRIHHRIERRMSNSFPPALGKGGTGRREGSFPIPLPCITVRPSMPLPLPEGATQVFNGILLQIYQWPQKLYDKSEATFECCVRPDGVAVIAFLDKDTVLLTKQEQPQKKTAFSDFPGGRVESGEDPTEAARREFREETGYEIGRIEPWFVHNQSGTIRYVQHFYFARDLRPAEGGARLDAGERITTFSMSRAELRRLILRDELRNRITSLAWLRLREDPEQLARLDTFLS